MSDRRSVRRPFPLALVAAVGVTLVSCGPPTAEELLDEANAAHLRGDAVETELRLQRVLEKDDLEVDLAVQAHMLRARNFFFLLNNVDKCRAELESVIEIASADSDAGTLAALFLADSHLATGGLGAFQQELDRHLETLSPSSRRALELNIHRWEVFAQGGASEEMVAFYPALVGQVVSAESLRPHERRDMVLNLTRVRAELARRMDDPEGAIQVFEMFITHFPDSDPARFMPFDIAVHLRRLGREDEAQGRIDAALSVLRERLTTVDSSAEQATVAISIGDGYALLGDLAAASREYGAVFDTHLDYHFRPQAMFRWADTLVRNERFEGAEAVATRLALEYPGTQWHQLSDQMLGQIASLQASLEAASAESVAQPASPESTT